ncbi:MAG: hypothetical protein KQH57_17360 [Actinomycetales bacterium]|nr:hypothetical protein [Actinomycetales bacterium]
MTAEHGSVGDVSEPVSAVLRDAKARARSTHYTVGTLRQDADGTVWLECSCGTVLRNGPTWTLDEHVRLHRAEAKYLELSQAAPPGIPRLIDLG